MKFFAIASSLFALEEHSPQVPGFTGDKDSLVAQLNDLNCASQLIADLKATADSVLEIHAKPTGDAELFLLKFSRANQYLDIESFRPSHLENALGRSDTIENDIESKPSLPTLNSDAEDTSYDNVALVYAKDSKQLNIAYPNYSTNVKTFVDAVSGYLP